jgi:Cu/Ag efflux protein CusF
MRLWKVIVLLNLALLVGLGLGALHGARQARRLEAEIARLRAAAEQAAPSTGSARGIVRGVLPSLGAVMLTHEALPGLMPAMTMAFPVGDPRLLEGLEPGDVVQFAVRREGDRLVLTAIEKVPGS